MRVRREADAGVRGRCIGGPSAVPPGDGRSGSLMASRGCVASDDGAAVLAHTTPGRRHSWASVHTPIDWSSAASLRAELARVDARRATLLNALAALEDGVEAPPDLADAVALLLSEVPEDYDVLYLCVPPRYRVDEKGDGRVVRASCRRPRARRRARGVGDRARDPRARGMRERRDATRRGWACEEGWGRGPRRRETRRGEARWRMASTRSWVRRSGFDGCDYLQGRMLQRVEVG